MMNTIQYTGDGAAAQPIVGVGFAPRIVMLLIGGATMDHAITTDTLQPATWYLDLPAALAMLGLNHIASLDPDGFTVGNGPPNIFNVLGVPYRAMCWG